MPTKLMALQHRAMPTGSVRLLEVHQLDLNWISTQKAKKHRQLVSLLLHKLVKTLLIKPLFNRNLKLLKRIICKGLKALSNYCYNISRIRMAFQPLCHTSSNKPPPQITRQTSRLLCQQQSLSSKSSRVDSTTSKSPNSASTAPANSSQVFQFNSNNPLNLLTSAF